MSASKKRPIAATEAPASAAGNLGWQVLIAGASGFLGRALTAAFSAEGHNVKRLVRRPIAAANEISWNPVEGQLVPAALAGVDVVINLAGENIAGGRWTRARREAIFRSRVDATRTLVAALQRSTRKPSVFVSASAVGFYGNRGDEVLTEDSAIGHSFLSEVCLAWETHAEGAERAGVRTALIRLGVVLSPAGGALAKMLPAFRLGLGGRMGDGRQWMSWISAADTVNAIYHVIRETRCRGPINFVAPEPVTNAQFAATLGQVLSRPARLPLPTWVLRIGLGEMAEGTLLASARAVPRRLEESGYRFRYPTLESALRSELVVSR